MVHNGKEFLSKTEAIVGVSKVEEMEYAEAFKSRITLALVENFDTDS